MSLEGIWLVLLFYILLNKKELLLRLPAFGMNTTLAFLQGRRYQHFDTFRNLAINIPFVSGVRVVFRRSFLLSRKQGLWNADELERTGTTVFLMTDNWEHCCILYQLSHLFFNTSICTVYKVFLTDDRSWKVRQVSFHLEMKTVWPDVVRWSLTL